MTEPHRIRKDGKLVYVSPADLDPDPILACEVEWRDLPSGSRIGVVHNWMAFDCRYGPDEQAQIDWHVKHGTRGAESWEVGQPVPGFGSSK